MGRLCTFALARAVTLMSCVVGVSCGSQEHGQSEIQAQNSVPLTYSVFGDSISVASLADTTQGMKLTAALTGRLLKSMDILREGDPLVNKDVRRKLQKISTVPKFSAFSGEMSWSHASRWKQKTGRPLEVKNYAFIGATSETLFEQIDTARGELERSRAKPSDIVTLMIGANDFCSGVTLSDFRNKVHFRLYQITKTFPRSLIQVVGIPDVNALLDSPDALAFTAQGHSMTCAEVRKRNPECLRSNEPGVSSSSRLSSMNQILWEEVERQRLGKGSYTPYEGKILFTPLPQGPSFMKSEILAADCYHPNAKGQQELADFTFAALENFSL
jgi:hypothetical protein